MDYDKLKYLSFLLLNAKLYCQDHAASTSNDNKSAANDTAADPTTDPTYCYHRNMSIALGEAYLFRELRFIWNDFQLLISFV